MRGKKKQRCPDCNKVIEAGGSGTCSVCGEELCLQCLNDHVNNPEDCPAFKLAEIADDDTVTEDNDHAA